MKVTMKHTAVKFIATLLSGTVIFLACPAKYAEAEFVLKSPDKYVDTDKWFKDYTVWNKMTGVDSFPTDGDMNRYDTRIETGWHYLNLIMTDYQFVNLTSGTISTAKLSPHVGANMRLGGCDADIGVEALLVLDQENVTPDVLVYGGNGYESLEREFGLFIKFAGYDRDGEKRYYIRLNNYGTPGDALYAPVLSGAKGQKAQSSLGLIPTDDMKGRYVAFDFWSKVKDQNKNEEAAKKFGIDCERYSNLQGDNLSVIAMDSFSDLQPSSAMLIGNHFPADSIDTWVFRKSNSSNTFYILPAGVFWRLYNDVKDSNGNITLKPDGGIESTSLKDTGLSLNIGVTRQGTSINSDPGLVLNTDPLEDFEVYIGDPWEVRNVKGTITIGQGGDGYDNFQIGNEKMVTFYKPGSKLEVGETGVVSISGTVVMHGTMDIKGTVVVQPGAKLLIYGGDTSVNKLRDRSDGWQDITRDTNVYLEGDLIILEDAAVAFVSGLETTFEVQEEGSIYNHGLLWMGCSTLYLSGKSDFVNYGEVYAGYTADSRDFQILSVDYDDGHLLDYKHNFDRFYDITASKIGYYAKKGVPFEVRNTEMGMHRRFEYANGKIVADGRSSFENRGFAMLASDYYVYGTKAVGFGKSEPEFYSLNEFMSYSLHLKDENDKYAFKEAKRPLS